MTNLLAKMEAELNDIPAKKAAILKDASLDRDQKVLRLRELEYKHKKLRQSVDAYIQVQNQFMELMGIFSVNY
jgi:hypothetical protein